MASRWGRTVSRVLLLALLVAIVFEYALLPLSSDLAAVVRNHPCPEGHGVSEYMVDGCSAVVGSVLAGWLATIIAAIVTVAVVVASPLRRAWGSAQGFDGLFRILGIVAVLTLAFVVQGALVSEVLVTDTPGHLVDPDELRALTAAMRLGTVPLVATVAVLVLGRRHLRPWLSRASV
jgi:hypothetical protein